MNRDLLENFFFTVLEFIFFFFWYNIFFFVAAAVSANIPPVAGLSSSDCVDVL
jgi:hypothetical protein